MGPVPPPSLSQCPNSVPRSLSQPEKIPENFCPIFVPTGRVIKYPKKCARRASRGPGGVSRGGPGGGGGPPPPPSPYGAVSRQAGIVRTPTAPGRGGTPQPPGPYGAVSRQAGIARTPTAPPAPPHATLDTSV